MSIVTFWNNSRTQTGVTSSAIAVATQMAIEHNMKILVVSTGFRDTIIKNCFWTQRKKKILGLFGNTMQDIGIEQNGIEALDRIIKSNKISSNLIRNYTNIVLENRLEVLTGVQENENIYLSIKDKYTQIVQLADQYYDMVIVDIDKDLDYKNKENILRVSDIIVPVISQRIEEIENIKKEIDVGKIFRPENTLLVIGKYFQKSKYNAKNISRNILKQKNLINTIFYNNLFFEASQEGCVIDLFINLMRLKDTSDENYQFINEVKQLSIDIEEKIKNLPRWK